MAMNEQNPREALQVRTFRTILTRIHCLLTPKLQNLNGNQSPKITKNRKKKTKFINNNQ